jgi:inorganic pyrophosphatase
MFEEIKHFFRVYKELEGKDTVVDEVQGRKEARAVIEHAIKNYVETFQM